MTDLLVNSMYPLDYFGLTEVSRIKFPDQSWWSSRQRYASVDPTEPTKQLDPSQGGARTSEYLEIDLGRLREINYLNFQVMRSPLDIRVEYDVVSGDDGTHSWVSTTRLPDMPFDHVIHFDADARNAWFNAQFYFTDNDGDLIETRFLRLRFTRRTHPWPTKTSNPFRWPVSVKSLRTARYIATLKQTIGLLVNTGAGDVQIDLDTDAENDTYEVRQRFQMPDDYFRADIAPALMGFSFEALATASISLGDGAQTPITLDDVAWKWTLLDVTQPQVNVLLTGITDFAYNNGNTWIDVFFDPAEPVQPDPSATYELRLRSLNALASPSLFGVSYDVTSPMPGGFQTEQLRSDGTTDTLTGTCLSLRVWGDVAESGTDVLGNTYRYGVRRNNAHNVYDNAKIGWMCEPQPSADAVESLYFDVRVPNPTSSAYQIPSVIDAFQASPRTQGVRMHFYYTDQGLGNDRPHNRDDWDNLIWTPVNVTYTLRGNQIIELPQTIRASYIKLEFSRLQPLPFRLPEYPKLPLTEYHRYPTWVEEQFENTVFKRTISDWFVKNLTPHRRQVLKELSDPVLEFQYKEREFLAALSTGDLSKRFANNQFVDLSNKALIDPVTGAKLFVDDGSLYKGTLTANIDRSSVLGQLVGDRFDPTVPNTVTEATVNQNLSQTPKVSTSNDRISEAFAFLASTPMWFNRRCRHHYKIERAGFNKQAYFVGINQVQFFRKDYTTRRDDALIMDNLHDSFNLAANTFQLDAASAIWRALPPYQTQNQQSLTLYVTYTINPTYTDEPVTFMAPAPPPGSSTSNVLDAAGVTLSGIGGAAYDITVASEPGGQGTVYQPGIDYDVAYTLDTDTGQTQNVLTISTLSSRMVASTTPSQIDAEMVVGRAIISAIETATFGVPGTFEFGTVSGVTITSALESFRGADAATVTAIAAPRQSGFVDSAVVTGTADLPSIANSFTQYIAHGGTSYTDLATIISAATIASVDAHAYIEAATVTAVAVPTATTANVYTDPLIAGAVSSGVAVRQGATGSDAKDTTATYATVPNAKFHSIWLRWSTLQFNGPNDISGWNLDAVLDNSFDHAKAHGYKIIIRVSCGADAPSWLYNTAVVGTPAVTELRLLSTETSFTGPISVPMFWDAKLLTYYTNMMTLLAAKFDPIAASGLTGMNTRRSDVGFFIAVSMPTSIGTEMSIGYGAAPTYLPASGAPTLSANLSSSAAGFTLSGSTTGFVNAMLLKIDSELMYCQTFDPVTKLAQVVRGFSGSAAAGHNAGATVQYIDTTAGGAWPTTPNTIGNYFGQNGIYELRTLNQSIWEGSGRTLATNKTNTQTAWQNAIDATASAFSIPTGIPCCTALGSVFTDAYAAASAVATKCSSVNWMMTTNLQPGRIVNTTQQAAAVAGGETGAINDPTKYDSSGTLWPTYYEAFSSNAASAISVAISTGGIIGFQTAGGDVFNTFNTPYAGDAMAFRLALEDGLTNFDPLFVETSTSTITTNNPPVAPSTDTTYHYLFGV